MKNPNEVSSVVRKSTTMTGEVYFEIPNTEADKNKGVQPMEMHSVFSRAKITILHKGDGEEGYKAASANLKPEVISLLAEKTRFVIQKMMFFPLETHDEPQRSDPAYTVRIKAGKMKGMTPAELLLDGKDEELKQQYRWLRDNAKGNFKISNEEQMAAIQNAFELRKAGQLNKDAVASTDEIILYDSSIKIPGGGRSEGIQSCYSIKVSVDLSKKESPYTVAVFNCVAPVKKDAKGMIQAILKEAKDQKSFSINCTEAEWFSFIESMDSRRRQFELSHYADMEKEMRKTMLEQRTGTS